MKSTQTRVAKTNSRSFGAIAPRKVRQPHIRESVDAHLVREDNPVQTERKLYGVNAGRRTVIKDDERKDGMKKQQWSDEFRIVPILVCNTPEHFCLYR